MSLVFLLHVLFLVSVNCDIGEQWIYDYRATVSAGVLLPFKSASKWSLQGSLVIQNWNGSLVVKLNDLKSTIYNGQTTEDINKVLFSEKISVPKDATILMKPFVLHFSQNGWKALNIQLNSDEQSNWSGNIKRALASIIQYQDDNNATYFTEEENGLHGECTVDYSNLNISPNMRRLVKVIDHSSCKPFPVHYKWNSAPTFLCPNTHQEPLIAGTKVDYILKNRGDHVSPVVESIVAIGTIYAQTFENTGDAQYIHTNITINLVSVTKDFKNIDTSDLNITSPLRYQLPSDDITMGRSKKSQSETLKKVSKYVDKLTDALVLNNLKVESKWIHDNTVLELLMQMSRLDLNSFHELFADIDLGTSYKQETAKNLFLEVLPKVGTANSVKFIKYLIVQKKIKAITAVNLLSAAPFYVSEHSESLLQFCEGYLTIGMTVKPEVNHAAILSFATMIYKAFIAGACSPDLFEQYIQKYFKLFTDSKDYEHQMLYLEGLNNLQLGSVSEYLDPIIRSDDSVYSRHIRFLAVWATMQLAPTRPRKVQEIYWPILLNRSEHLEMRVAAFTMVLLANPSPSQVLSLYWFMQTETDQHLYNFYYTTMKSLQHTTFSCYGHIGRLTAYITRFLRSPTSMRYWVSGNYLLDYSDSKRGFGMMFQLFLVGNPLSDRVNVAYFTMNSQAMGLSVNQVSLYLKLQGVSEAVTDKLFKFKSANLNLEGLLNVLKLTRVDLKSPDPVHIEIIAHVQGKTVFSFYINQTTFHYLTDGDIINRIYHLFQTDSHINYQAVQRPYASSHMYPTALGTLAQVNIESSSVTTLRGNITQTLDNNIITRRNQIDLGYSFYGICRIRSYNPVEDTFHSALREQSFLYNFQVNNEIFVNITKMSVGFSVSLPTDHVSGFKIHSRSSTTISSENELSASILLKLNCPACSAEYVVSNPTRYSEQLVNLNVKVLGVRFLVEYFDADKPLDSLNLLARLQESHRSNYNFMPIAKPVLALIHISNLLRTSPEESLGMSISVSNEQSSQITGEINYLSEDRIKVTEGTKNNWKLLHISVKHKTDTHEDILHEWNLTASYKTPTKTAHIVKIKINGKSHDEPDWKLCLESDTNIKELPTDVFDTHAASPLETKLTVVFGINKLTTKCPTDGARLGYNIRAEVSEEQMNLLSESKIWPFNQCKYDANGYDLIPFTEACFLVAKEMTTFRKYTGELYFDKMPSAIVHGAQRLKSISELLVGFPIEPLSKNADDEQAFNASIVLPVTENKIKIEVNDKSSTIQLPAVIDNSNNPLLLNSRLYSLVNLGNYFGVIDTCTATPNKIVTIYNNTFSYAPKCLTLAMGDCSEQPRFALFYEKVKIGSKEVLKMKMYIGGNYISVTPHGNTIAVSINDQSIDVVPDYTYPPQEYFYDFKITKPEKGKQITIVSTLARVKVWFTLENIFIVIPSSYRGFSCGLCSNKEVPASETTPEIC